MSDDKQVVALIRAWAPTQRWFGGKGRNATLSATRLADLAEQPTVTIWALRAEYADGEPETYQVPLVVRPEPVDSLDHVLLGTIELDGATHWAYDALHDQDVTPAWL